MLKPRKKMTKKELKKDPFFERMDALVRFYHKHQQKIWTVILVVVVVAVGGSFINRSIAKKQSQAKSQLTIAQFYLRSGQEEFAIAIFSEVKDGLYGDKYAGDAAYYLGYINFENQNYEKAKENYHFFLESKGDDTLMKSSALASLGSIEELQGNYNIASEYYRKALEIADLTYLKMSYGEKAFQNALKAGNITQAQLILEDLEKLELNEIQTNKLMAYASMIEK
ncbi:MAG: tetratricopeptide repeat protein [Candidatus Marinimicrobia bacterium]|nr:tetratricopeptide repeat protein [Candidatus Neomarinimicrobiota bacterium]MDD5582958.1 tetratricopeptide repeat protein [Candidatus Neomarinimicrobiota bacterium]